MSWESSKPSSTPSFTGVYASQQTDGLTQNADFVVPSFAPLNTQYPTAVPEAVPAAVRVQLTQNNGIVQTGSPQQYAVRLALNGTLQLTPLRANALNQQTNAVLPNIFNFVYTSRNTTVCTVSQNGLVTAVGRGEVEILIGAVRQVNASFVGATPPAGQTGCEEYAFLNVTVIA